MISKDKHQVGEPVADEHGRTVTVYQDHEGVTLDLGLQDRNFTVQQAATLMVWMSEAIGAAQLWRADAEQAARELAGDEGN